MLLPTTSLPFVVWSYPDVHRIGLRWDCRHLIIALVIIIQQAHMSSASANDILQHERQCFTTLPGIGLIDVSTHVQTMHNTF